MLQVNQLLWAYIHNILFLSGWGDPLSTVVGIWTAYWEDFAAKRLKLRPLMHHICGGLISSGTQCDYQQMLDDLVFSLYFPRVDNPLLNQTIQLPYISHSCR